MSHLAQLRQKIRSIQTTKKITHAVRLVSMSLYNKLDKQEAPLKHYTKDIKNLFVSLVQHAPSWRSSLLFPGDVFDARPLHIIVATSKGLCGSLNSNLLRYVRESLFIEQHQRPRFIVIGQKAVAFVKELENADLAYTYAEVSSNNYIALADELVDKIIHGPEQYSSVSFYLNEASSFFIQKPKKFTLIPMSIELVSDQAPDVVETDSSAKNVPDSFIWEQATDDILQYLSIRYLRSSIIYTLFQALRAEHSARFLAMENSTNNAEKYLERLTLQFNKLRQSLITKEVSELASGLQPR